MEIKDSDFGKVIYEEVLPAISKAYCIYSEAYNHAELSVSQNRAAYAAAALERNTKTLIDVLGRYIRAECETHKKIFAKSEQP